MDATEVREQTEMDGAPVEPQETAQDAPDEVTSAAQVDADSEADRAADGTADGVVADAAAETADDLLPADGVDGASLMEQFLNDPTHDYKSLKYGDVMEGILMHIDRDELLVDIGSKAEGIVPAKEYSSLSSEEKDALNVGDNILVFVVQAENPEGHPVVSIDRARQEKSWRRLQELHERNEIIEAEVTNYNKGGLLVNLDGVRGFVPASQVTEIRGGDEASKQADMARLIGMQLPLKVIEINRHRNRLILSERQAIQERRDEMKERLIAELNEGEVRKGRVSSICDFGAFVDIGGADGLVHLSELSWSRVRHPSEVLKVGAEVDVYVLGINAQEKKIALSIKRTQAEPWSRVAATYEVGELVRGSVTQLANFGAFARIEDGIEGLIHVSELADERIQHPKQVVHESQELILRIIRIDPQRRRMGLSLRRALDTPDAELVAKFGETILEERDALARQLRASLDAEGLTGTSAVETDERPADGTTVTTEQGPAAVPVQPDGAADASSAEVRTPGEEGPAVDIAAASTAARPQPRQRPQRPQRPAPEVPAGFEGENMSAMEIAFAMAGAQADLADNVEVTSEPEAAPAVAAAEPVEVAASVEEAAEPVEAAAELVEAAVDPVEAEEPVEAAVDPAEVEVSAEAAADPVEAAAESVSAEPAPVDESAEAVSVEVVDAAEASEPEASAASEDTGASDEQRSE